MFPSYRNQSVNLQSNLKKYNEKNEKNSQDGITPEDKHQTLPVNISRKRLKNTKTKQNKSALALSMERL